MEEKQEWVFELTIPLMQEYWSYYKKIHPKAKNHPLKANGKIKNLVPYPLSMNQTIIMKRPQANATKQKWSDFCVWWCKKLGYENLLLDKVQVIIEFYFHDERERDIVDNYNLKYIDDGFVKCGFLKDDNCKVIQQAHYLYKGVSKENPKTRIIFRKLKGEEIKK